MNEYKKSKLKIERTAKKVERVAQAIAIGLSEARKAGAKIPKNNIGAGRRGSRRK